MIMALSDVFRVGMSLILCGVFLSSTTAYAFSPPEQTASPFFVAPSGMDTNSGSFDAPWRSIQYAVDQANPGDIIYVRAGTYYESILIHRSGTSAAPIRLQNFEDEDVRIDGGGSPALSDILGHDYWVIEGFTFDSYHEHTILFDAWGCSGTCGGSHHWTLRDNTIIGSVKIYGSYNLFENNEVDGSHHKGNENGFYEHFDITHHNTYRGNHIHDFYDRGIWTLYRTHDVLIENNLIHNIGYDTRGMCIDTDGHSSVEWQHVIRNNHIYNCGEAAIELENTFATLVENNHIHHFNRKGITVINYGPSTSSPGEIKCQVGGDNNQYGDTNGDNSCEGDLNGNILRGNLIYSGGSYAAIGIYHAGGVEIYSNTISGIVGPGVFLDSSAASCPQIALRSNIITGSNYANISIAEHASIVQDDHNLLNLTSSELVYDVRSIETGYSVATYQSATGKAQGSLQANPQFNDVNSNDFSLQDSSPAIDAGLDTGQSLDLFATPRPQGQGYDMGAIESGFTLTFIDVPFNHIYYPEIEALYQNGYIAGCSLSPPMYCPEDSMTRAHSAVFVERGIHGGAYSPTQPQQQIFSDVNLDSWAASWVTALWNDEYTSGCNLNPLLYCPDQEHTRAEGSVFFLRMLYGATYMPPAAEGLFSDVPIGSWFAPWVEQAYLAGILEPCQTSPATLICPEEPLLRSEAARMMVRAKNIPLP